MRYSHFANVIQKVDEHTLQPVERNWLKSFRGERCSDTVHAGCERVSNQDADETV